MQIIYVNIFKLNIIYIHSIKIVVRDHIKMSFTHVHMHAYIWYHIIPIFLNFFI